MGSACVGTGCCSAREWFCQVQRDQGFWVLDPKASLPKLLAHVASASYALAVLPAAAHPSFRIPVSRCVATEISIARHNHDVALDTSHSTCPLHIDPVRVRRSCRTSGRVPAIKSVGLCPFQFSCDEPRWDSIGIGRGSSSRFLHYLSTSRSVRRQVQRNDILIVNGPFDRSTSLVAQILERVCLVLRPVGRTFSWTPTSLLNSGCRIGREIGLGAKPQLLA
ncbi:hypothetical protein BKA93DRAFT_159451 [Sparassis latifolia]